jgi:phosphate transport system substrate-binding protein
VGTSGSEGVVNTLKSSLNSIGYVELDYALTKGVPIALVKIPTGNFIAPSLDSTQEAVGNAVALNSLPAGDKSWTTAQSSSTQIISDSEFFISNPVRRNEC